MFSQKIRITPSMLLALPCLTALLLAPAVMAQEVQPPNDMIARLRVIHVELTENATRERVVKSQLQDQFSGYPDLAKVLLEAVNCPPRGCDVKGPLLRFDVIEGWCRKDRGAPDKVIKDHKPEEVREAYKMAWYERNGDESRDLTLEQILRGD